MPDDPTKPLKDLAGFVIDSGTKIVSEGVGLAKEMIEHGPADPTAVVNAFTGAIEKMMASVDTHFTSIIGKLEQLYTAAPKPPTPPPPLDPKVVMDSIAQAITSAEYIFNSGTQAVKGAVGSGNLLIADGTVDLEFTIKDPLNLGSANAKVSLRISPKPVE